MNATTAMHIRLYGIATTERFTASKYREAKRKWNALSGRERGELRRRMMPVIAELRERRRAARRG